MVAWSRATPSSFFRQGWQQVKRKEENPCMDGQQTKRDPFVISGISPSATFPLPVSSVRPEQTFAFALCHARTDTFAQSLSNGTYEWTNQNGPHYVHNSGGFDAALVPLSTVLSNTPYPRLSAVRMTGGRCFRRLLRRHLSDQGHALPGDPKPLSWPIIRLLQAPAETGGWQKGGKGPKVKDEWARGWEGEGPKEEMAAPRLWTPIYGHIIGLVDDLVTVPS